MIQIYDCFPESGRQADIEGEKRKQTKRECDKKQIRFSMTSLNWKRTSCVGPFAINLNHFHIYRFITYVNQILRYAQNCYINIISCADIQLGLHAHIFLYCCISSLKKEIAESIAKTIQCSNNELYQIFFMYIKETTF